MVAPSDLLSRLSNAVHDSLLSLAISDSLIKVVSCLTDLINEAVIAYPWESLAASSLHMLLNTSDQASGDDRLVRSIWLH